MPEPCAIIVSPAPEDVEIAWRRREVHALRAELAALESDLAALRNRLHAFEGRYIRQVGVLYVQLDDWHDRLAELQGMPLQSRSHNTSPSVTDAETVTDSDANLPGKAASQASLKSLFREVAKRIHPDHARDCDDERHRTQLMAQANAALLRQDAAALHRMLHAHDLPIVATDKRLELAQIVALIGQLKQDRTLLDAEMDALNHSEMANLQRRTIAAAALGQDVLAELAARVRGQIGIAMSRYEREVARRKANQAAADPTLFVSAETPARS